MATKTTSTKAKAATPKATKAKKVSTTKAEALQAKAKKHREPKVAPEKAGKKLSQFQAAIKALAAARNAYAQKGETARGQKDIARAKELGYPPKQ
jgi:hypothetical protein